MDYRRLRSTSDAIYFHQQPSQFQVIREISLRQAVKNSRRFHGE